MFYTLENLCEASGYKLKTISKLLSVSGVSNHFELSKDDLMKLYSNLYVVSFKAQLLKNYLRAELCDELCKVKL